MSLWQHKEDPILCWGELLGDTAIKLFFTAHTLSDTPVDKEWETAVQEAGDYYATIIIERPTQWTVGAKIINSPIRCGRYYVSKGTPVFVLERLFGTSWQLEPQTGVKLQLTAGMALSDLLALAEEFNWSFYFSKEFLESSISNPERVIIWGAQKDFTPTWKALYNGRRAYHGDPAHKRSGYFWEKVEEENLLGMYSSEKYSLGEMAEYHKRSGSALETRLKKLGCFKQGHLTDEELRLLNICNNENGNLEELARRLQRAPGHCRWILSEQERNR